MAIERQNAQDTQGSLRVADVGGLPDDPSANYSYTFTRNGPSGAIDTITKTKDGVSWLKTLTYTGDNVTAVSTWSLVP